MIEALIAPIHHLDDTGVPYLAQTLRERRVVLQDMRFAAPRRKRITLTSDSLSPLVVGRTRGTAIALRALGSICVVRGTRDAEATSNA